MSSNVVAAAIVLLGFVHLHVAAVADPGDALPLIDSPQVAREQQQAWAQKLGKPVQWTNSVGMVMQLIPPGRFVMGDSDADGEAGGDAPRHEVTLTKPFYIGATEVTRAQWEKVTGVQRSTFFPGPDMPINFITVYDAEAFIKALNKAEPEAAYALPTEAQWEYAARAGVKSDFVTGSDVKALEQAGWVLSNAGDTLHPVGQKAANAFGLFDVHGNVWEWCSDDYDPAGYRMGEPVNPTGPTRSLYGYQVLRGGSIYYGEKAAALGNRAFYQASRSEKHIGFRVVLPIAAEKK
jgi:formylglycine-generating enzyme required for sulfatase activity